MRTRACSGLAIAATVLAACAEHPALSEPPVQASAEPVAPAEPPRYEIRQLPTLGGAGRINGLTNGGLAAGFSASAEAESRRAVLWRQGEPLDLGTLGGPAGRSSVPWAGVNAEGMVVGITEGTEPDPLGQSWSCDKGDFFPTRRGLVCHAFVWDGGVMQQLPTLGGANGFATGVNNRGQVVGWSETAEPDPTCEEGTRVLGFLAALWEPRHDRVRALPPYPGDRASAATAINERGQVVGISGDCDQAVGRYSARRAVMWDGDDVIDLGNLGGDAWHTPMALNSRGDVVGFSNVAGGPPGAYAGVAFLWTRERGIEKIGVLDGNLRSQAQGINARGQVVGVSFGGDAPQRAFLWHGRIHDLNDLALDYDGRLIDARDINDRGEISGWALDASGALVPFIARPVEQDG